jgi:hypothetical protein
MARTFRRSADFARRHLTLRDDWARADAILGRKTYTHGPRQTSGWTEWELVTDNYGTDSAKPYKRTSIDRHKSSIRRFVTDALAQGFEPVVCNDRSNWTRWDVVRGITIPIEEA